MFDDTNNICSSLQADFIKGYDTPNVFIKDL